MLVDQYDYSKLESGAKYASETALLYDINLLILMLHDPIRTQDWCRKRPRNPIIWSNYILKCSYACCIDNQPWIASKLVAACFRIRSFKIIPVRCQYEVVFFSGFPFLGNKRREFSKFLVTDAYSHAISQNDKRMI